MTMYLSGQAVRRSIVHPHTNRFVSTKSLPNILSSHSTTLGNEGCLHTASAISVLALDQAYAAKSAKSA